MDHVTFMELFATGSDRSVDQEEFIVPGTYSLKVPPNVTSMSFVAIQGGQGGASAGGDGGRLAYLNNVPVTPNETLTVIVGAGGAGAMFDSGNAAAKGSVGVHSSVKRGTTTLVTTDPAVAITGVVRWQGGIGGNGIVGSTADGGGGAGAGGYAGAGGNGASYSSSAVVPATAGTGGAGGGGGMTNGYFDASPYWVGYLGGQGGGTDIKGQGANGAAGASKTSAGVVTFPDSGGTGSPAGSAGYGGGGGGGSGTVSTIDGTQTYAGGAAGTGGAVRAIWPGNIRQYPSTRTADE